MESPKLRRCRLHFQPWPHMDTPSQSPAWGGKEKKKEDNPNTGSPQALSTTRAILSEVPPFLALSSLSWKCPAWRLHILSWGTKDFKHFCCCPPRQTHSHLYGEGTSLREWGRAGKRMSRFPRQMLQFYSRPSSSSSIARDNKSYGQEIVGLNGK